MKFKKVLQKTLNEMARSSLPDNWKNMSPEEAAKEYIENEIRSGKKTDKIKKGVGSTFRNLEGAEEIKKEVKKQLGMGKPKKKTSDSSRAASGGRFETKFEKTYEVEKTAFPDNKSNISLKYISSGGNPAISSFKNLSPEGVKFDSSVANFRIFKSDYFNNSKNLYYKGKGEEAEPNFEGSEKGNHFELKKYPDSKIETGVSVLYSEAKKVASRGSFIKIFGNEEHNKLWDEINKEEPKEGIEKIKDWRKRKNQLWKEIKESIKKEVNDDINKHNRIIKKLLAEAANFLNAEKELIKQAIINDLDGKKWFLVLEDKPFSFREISINNFVDSLKLDITHWIGVERVRLSIGKEVFEEDVKDRICQIAETATLTKEPEAEPRPKPIPREISNIVSRAYNEQIEYNFEIEFKVIITNSL